MAKCGAENDRAFALLRFRLKRKKKKLGLGQRIDQKVNKESCRGESLARSECANGILKSSI